MSSHLRRNGKWLYIERDITLAMHRNRWQISVRRTYKELLNNMRKAARSELIEEEQEMKSVNYQRR
jgi:hypothetical protein